MDTYQAITMFLLSFGFISGQDQSHVSVTVREGSAAIFNCSEKVNVTIDYVSWVTLNNTTRNAITTCYRKNRVCSTENCKLSPNCSSYTDINDRGFHSQLTLRDVTSDWRHQAIECVMVDTQNQETNDIWVVQSYHLNVYRVSENISCHAQVDTNNAISVSCEVPIVYPGIVCRMFPELERTFTLQGPEPLVSRLPGLPNITHVKKRLKKRVEYYRAFCTSWYYPRVTGRYGFHIEIYTTSNLDKPVVNIVTNRLEILVVPINYTDTSRHVHRSLLKANTAFYTLMASVLLIGISSFLVLSWVIWTRRCTRCSSPSDATQMNIYESISDNVEAISELNNCPIGLSDEGYGESTEGGDIVVSDSEFDEDEYPQVFLGTGCYINSVPVSRQQGVDASEIVYIDPVTPTSTLNCSLSEISNPDLTCQGDNATETHINSVSE